MNCKDWLRDFMAGNGPMPSKYVADAAKAAGFTRAELKNARKELQAKTEHRFEDEEAWYWELPEGAR